VATPVPVIPTPSQTQPVPVIPDGQLIPSPNIPSSPVRVLPAPALRAAPSARIQIDPSITVSEEYTDNFDLSERNRRSNFRSTISPTLGVAINGAFLKGLVSYKLAPSYDTAVDDVSLFHSLLGQIVWEVNPRWKLTLADTFTHSDEPSDADRLGLRQQRQTFTRNTLLLASDYVIGRVATRQSYQMASFTDDLGEETKSHTLALSATAPLYQTNSISGGYEYLTGTSTGSRTDPSTALTSSDDFDITGHRFTAAATRKLNTLQSVGVTTSYALRHVTSQTREDFQLWNVSTFTDYELPGRLRLHLTLGVSGLNTDSDDVGPNFSTKSTLSYQFARAVISVGVDRGFSETFTEGENFGVVATQGVSASLSYSFTPSLTGSIGASYRRSKTTNIGDDVGTNQRIDEAENWGGLLGVIWQVRKGLSVEVGYSYIKQIGSDDRQSTGTAGQFGGRLDTNNNYTENKVRAAVNFTF
jgi:hypothetical protein